MQFDQILFIAFGVITLGAALFVVVRRDLFHASLALIVSCVGMTGLLALLEAPLIAALQLFVFAGGIAALIRANPLPAGVTRSSTLAVNPRWWGAALVAAALCGILGWAALSYGGDLLPAGDVVTPGAASSELARLALPLATAVTLLSVALVGAAQIVRRR